MTLREQNTDAAQNEKFADTKARLEKRTGIKGKSFEKIKFAVVRRATYPKAQYLNDGKSRRLFTRRCTSNFFLEDVLWDVATADDDMLGLDHVDRTRTMRNGLGDLFLR